MWYERCLGSSQRFLLKIDKSATENCNKFIGSYDDKYMVVPKNQVGGKTNSFFNSGRCMPTGENGRARVEPVRKQ